jgi:hypothetical protein
MGSSCYNRCHRMNKSLPQGKHLRALCLALKLSILPRLQLIKVGQHGPRME